MDLLKFKSGEVDRTANLLPVGRHDVRIARAIIVTDRMKDLQGTLKTEAELQAKGVDYKDVVQQLAVTYTRKGGGVLTHRYNTAGFERYGEMEDPEGFFCSAHPEGYAVNEETGERVVDPEREKQCENILNELFEAAGLEHGSSYQDLEGCELSIEVYHDEWEGRAIPKVRAPRKVGYSSVGVVETAAAEEEDADF